MTKFEPGKTYPLRGGGEGEVFAVKDGKLWGRRIKDPIEGTWSGTDWYLNGKYWGKVDSSNDLIAPPTTVTRYFNIYRETVGDAYASKDLCIGLANPGALAKAVPVTFTIHPDGKIEVSGGVG